MNDLMVLAHQLGRPPRAFRRVAVRCPYGAPAVVEQKPFDADGEPFPTQFWLTCRHLSTAIARLEAAGGVERWTAAAAADRNLGASLARAHAEQRDLRPELPGGVGGSTRGGSLKCLHAHAAFALARPGYALGDRILAEAAPLLARRSLLRDSMIGPAVDLDLARHQWEEGRRTVERSRVDRAAYERLSSGVDVVTAELTRRIGQVFTLAELAALYDGADGWTLEAIHDAFPDDIPTRISTVADAAFDLYSRRASDYAP